MIALSLGLAPAGALVNALTGGGDILNAVATAAEKSSRPARSCSSPS